MTLHNAMWLVRIWTVIPIQAYLSRNQAFPLWCASYRSGYDWKIVEGGTGIPDLVSPPIGKALSHGHQFVDLYIDFWDPVDKKLRREARAELSLWLKRRNQLALWGL